MLISTRGRYALRVMVDLAQHDTGEYIPLKEIAERQGISKEYLNSILKTLVENDLLLSLRGKGGGYKLTHEPTYYSVGMVLRLVEGNLAPVSCVSGADPCPREVGCPSLKMWRKLDSLINNFFDSITITDLMEDEENFFDNEEIERRIALELGEEKPKEA